MEHENDCDTNYKQCAWYGPQRVGQGTWRVGNQRTSRDQASYSSMNKTDIWGDLVLFKPQWKTNSKHGCEKPVGVEVEVVVVVVVIVIIIIIIIIIIRQIPRSCQGAEKDVKHEGDGGASCWWCTWDDHQGPQERDWRNWKIRTIKTTTSKFRRLLHTWGNLVTQNSQKISQAIGPIGWGCRIHRLHLYREVRHRQWMSWIWH